MNIRDFIPPIVASAFTKPTANKKLYSDYAEALQDCTQDAYEYSELVQVIVAKTKNYIKNLDHIILDVRKFSLLTTILQINKPEVNIIDFGGACGTHYFEMRKLVPEAIRLNYIVVETPRMVEHARKEFANDELKFEKDLGEANNMMDKIDIIYSSGTIQCVDHPLIYLAHLLQLPSTYILFNRLGFTLGNYDVITIHENMLSWNGVGPLPEGFTDHLIKYPFHFIRKEKFMEMMKEYKMVYQFADETGIFPVNNERLEGLGMLFKKG